MVAIYVDVVEHEGFDVNTIRPRWKTDVCVQLFKDGFYTLEQIPEDVRESTRAKLIADGFITA